MRSITIDVNRAAIPYVLSRASRWQSTMRQRGEVSQTVEANALRQVSDRTDARRLCDEAQ